MNRLVHHVHVVGAAIVGENGALPPPRVTGLLQIDIEDPVLAHVVLDLYAAADRLAADLLGVSDRARRSDRGDGGGRR